MKQLITRSQKAPPVVTWAQFPGPTLVPTGYYYFSDIGVNGSLWYNTGTTLIPVGRIKLLDDSVGFIVPALVSANAATYSQSSNTVTVTSTAHNIPNTIHNGKNCYLAIGAVSTGVAPVGYATGWFTNFQYVDANTFTVQATNSQTGTGNVNTTTATVTLPISHTLKGGVLGLSGKIECYMIQSHNNSAGVKVFKAFFGGQAWLQTNGTTSISLSACKWLKNRGVAIKQLSCVATGIVFGLSSGIDNTRLSIDTASDVSQIFTLQAAVASDYVALDQLEVSLVGI